DPATTREAASADFAIAQLARAVGDAPLYNAYATRAQYWQNTFNPKSGYVHPRAPDGTWRMPFDPAAERNFVAGNAAQYTFMVPHDLRGLCGGPGRPYVRGLTVSGKPTTRTWVRWADLAGGATVAFTMGAKPDPSWGTARADAPPSFDQPGVDLALHKHATGSKPCAP